MWFVRYRDFVEGRLFDYHKTPSRLANKLPAGHSLLLIFSFVDGQQFTIPQNIFSLPLFFSFVDGQQFTIPENIFSLPLFFSFVDGQQFTIPENIFSLPLFFSFEWGNNLQYQLVERNFFSPSLPPSLSFVVHLLE